MRVPVVCALEAEVELADEQGTRTSKADELYQDHGIEYLTKKPEELLMKQELIDKYWPREETAAQTA